MSKTLSVVAIEQGTVIDHIPAGQATKILQLLQLDACTFPVTVGIHLHSGRQGSKDIIKLHGHVLSEQQVNNLSIFAPRATVNLIEGYQVTQKKPVNVPDEIRGILSCPNKNCITRFEPNETHFRVDQGRYKVRLSCVYCEKQFEVFQFKSGGV